MYTVHLFGGCALTPYHVNLTHCIDEVFWSTQNNSLHANVKPKRGEWICSASCIIIPVAMTESELSMNCHCLCLQEYLHQLGIADCAGFIFLDIIKARKRICSQLAVVGLLISSPITLEATCFSASWAHHDPTSVQRETRASPYDSLEEC